jgi:hypothetical protein
MRRTDLVNDPHFQALDALANGPKFDGRADAIRQLLVDWLRACEDDPDPLAKKFPEGFDEFDDDDTLDLDNPAPWWRRAWAWLRRS